MNVQEFLTAFANVPADLVKEVKEATDKNDLALMREQFKAAYERDTKLSDATLIQMIAASDDDQDDWSEFMLEVEQAADETEKDKQAALEAGLSISTEAFTMGDKIAHNDEFNAKANEVIAAGETTKRGPLEMLLVLRKTYSTDDLYGMPVVGMTEKALKEKFGQDTNRRYDKFRRPDSAARTGFVASSFYMDMGLRTDYGKAQAAELDKLATPEGAFASKHMQEVHVRKYEDRLDALAKLIGNAVRIEQVKTDLEALSDGKLEVKFTMIEDKDGNDTDRVAAVNEPILIRNPAKPDQFRTMSIRQFINLNLDKVKAGGGNINALIAAVARGTKTAPGTATPGQSVPEIGNLAQAENYIAALAAWSRNENNYLQMLQHIQSAKDAASMEGLILSIVSIGDRFGALAARLEAKRDQIVADREKALAASMARDAEMGKRLEAERKTA